MTAFSRLSSRWTEGLNLKAMKVLDIKIQTNVYLTSEEGMIINQTHIHSHKKIQANIYLKGVEKNSESKTYLCLHKKLSKSC